MTDKSCKEWMREKGYLPRWILPQLGLNAYSKYGDSPIGNSPELMMWDSSLNADVKAQIIRHITMTKDLEDEDPRMFSISTPKRIDSCLLRLLDPELGPDAGVPLGSRIVEDATKCFGNNLLRIIQAMGALVEGLGNRTGHRFVATGVNHGGKRVPSPYFERAELGSCRRRVWATSDFE